MPAYPWTVHIWHGISAPCQKHSLGFIFRSHRTQSSCPTIIHSCARKPSAELTCQLVDSLPLSSLAASRATYNLNLALRRRRGCSSFDTDFLPSVMNSTAVCQLSTWLGFGTNYNLPCQSSRGSYHENEFSQSLNMRLTCYQAQVQRDSTIEVRWLIRQVLRNRRRPMHRPLDGICNSTCAPILR